MDRMFFPPSCLSYYPVIFLFSARQEMRNIAGSFCNVWAETFHFAIGRDITRCDGNVSSVATQSNVEGWSVTFNCSNIFAERYGASIQICVACAACFSSSLIFNSRSALSRGR